jgi:hypothetical protein
LEGNATLELIEEQVALRASRVHDMMQSYVRVKTASGLLWMHPPKRKGDQSRVVEDEAELF